MIKPDKIPTRGKLRATPHYHGDGVISMFRPLGQLSPHESHRICDYRLRGVFYCFCGWTEEQQLYFVNK